jgi:hypothetical protein
MRQSRLGPLAALDGTQLGGRTLNVREAYPRPGRVPGRWRAPQKWGALVNSQN